MHTDRLGDGLDAEREEIVAWIERYWDELAAFAWRCYIGEGRGIVLLQGDWHGEVAVAYQTPAIADEAGAGWPEELIDAVRSYAPATDIIFLVRHETAGTLLAMRATPPRLAPRDAGQRDGSPPLVPSA